jgi:adenylate kinase family enzyme
MYSVEINRIEQYKFLSYLAATYHTQNNKDIKKFIAKTKKDEKHKCLIYPAYGKFEWVHNDDIFQIEFYEEGESKACADNIEFLLRLYVFNESIEKIQSFLSHTFNYIADTENQDKEKVKLYVSKCNQYCACWDIFDTVKVQSIENIFIDKKIKENIISSIDKFISSADKYVQFGRNHKLNILLSGIPGSGKTSLCKALAKKYGYSIYVVNFNKTMTDEYLINLTSDVKDKSIILYEDIDVFYTERVSREVGVSFSCFINILDGTLCKGSGNINIITTNYPNKIDSALLRPGRIDKIITFDYPKKEEIKEAFKCLATEDDADFDTFYSQIKNNKFSMSAIIDYLFIHQDDYLDKTNIDELIKQHQFIQDITKEDTCSKLYS